MNRHGDLGIIWLTEVSCLHSFIPSRDKKLIWSNTSKMLCALWNICQRGAGAGYMNSAVSLHLWYHSGQTIFHTEWKLQRSHISPRWSCFIHMLCCHFHFLPVDSLVEGILYYSLQLAAPKSTQRIHALITTSPQVDIATNGKTSRPVNSD